jgi:hypothetical protein
MNINIYIEDKLAEQLAKYAERFHRKKFNSKRSN